MSDGTEAIWKLIASSEQNWGQGADLLEVEDRNLDGVPGIKSFDEALHTNIRGLGHVVPKVRTEFTKNGITNCFQSIDSLVRRKIAIVGSGAAQGLLCVSHGKVLQWGWSA